MKHVSPAFGYAYLGSIAALWGIVAVLIALPVHEMWFKKPTPRRADAGPTAGRPDYDL